MILSDRTIKALVKEKHIIIDPYEEKNVQPSSVDLVLGEGFLIPDYHNTKYISLDNKLNFNKHEGSKIIIPPNHFILGATLEYIKIPKNICAKLEGKSSIGRKGLFVQTAGHVNPGFEGNLTLEFYNAGDISFELNSYKRVCQIIFYFLDGEVEKAYFGKYQNQLGVTGIK